MFAKPLDNDSLERLVERHSSSSCLLRELLQAGPDTAWQLSELGQLQLKKLIASGYSLRAGWPREWGSRLEEWFGRRLFLSFAGNFSPCVKFSSIVSSAVGRDGQRLPQWPTLVDLSLQSIARHGSRLLLAAGTTTYDWTREFAPRAGLDYVKIEFAKPSSVATWLRTTTRELLVSGGERNLRNRLWTSPLLNPHLAVSEIPLQDSFTIGLSDSVVALSVRTGGKIAQLLRNRLSAPEFPLGSVYIALSAHRLAGTAGGEHEDWLSRGAVGWYILQYVQRPAVELLPCCQTIQPARQQLCAPLPDRWHDLAADDDWQWLTHCTRGNAGPLPEESGPRFRQRLWLAGEQTHAHPLRTLMHICSERLLRGSSHITRTAQPSISFSSVPLLKLLSRRNYRSHLGRWDWEPYGVLVRQAALQQLGAHPVLYRPETEYAALPDEQKPYFQPTTPSNAGVASHAVARNDWSAEREWRLLGDLLLWKLPGDAVLFFVRTQQEALQLSRCSAWPVYWVETAAP